MELRNRIIEKATRMFAEDGIKAVRMDDIATQCGISKRTLYENFKDRDELIRQSLRYHLGKYEKDIQEMLEGAQNVLDEFWVLFSHGSEFRESNKNVMRDLIKFYPEIFNDFMSKHHCKILDHNTERFRRGQNDGLVLNDIDAEFMSQNLTSYLYGMRRDFEGVEPMRWDREHKLSPRSFPFVMMLYFRGMATEAGREYIDTKILNGIK